MDALNNHPCYPLSMENKVTAVLILENHPMMQESLSAAIAGESDFAILRSTPDDKYAFSLNLSEDHDVVFLPVKPDIVIISLDYRTINSLRVLSRLHRQLSSTPILALTTAEVPGQEYAALAHGAHAVLTKTASRAELLGALRSLRSESTSAFRLQSPIYPHSIIHKEQ